MIRALTLALLAILAACAAQQPVRQTAEPAALEPEIVIRGALAFRDGIAPPPGSVATVTVADFADDSAAPVATTVVRVENAQAMLPFELNVAPSRLDTGGQYVVRAVLASPGNKARWITDVAQIIDATRERVDIGVLLMTQSRDDD
jgi:uncharacterized lipoprotein YbaY